MKIRLNKSRTVDLTNSGQSLRLAADEFIHY